jgi:hypothetical protein
LGVVLDLKPLHMLTKFGSLCNGMICLPDQLVTCFTKRCQVDRQVEDGAKATQQRE